MRSKQSSELGAHGVTNLRGPLVLKHGPLCVRFQQVRDKVITALRIAIDETGGHGVTPTRPILRYHGGKWRLAPWVLFMPRHRIYVEPFGGGAVCSCVSPGPMPRSTTTNGMWPSTSSASCETRPKAERLKIALKLTPFSRTEFMAVGNDLRVRRRRAGAANDTWQAAGFSPAATNADFSTGFRANSHRWGTTPAHDWAHYPEQIRAFVDRLAGVCIENRDALDLIPQHDSPQTLYFVDPPSFTPPATWNSGNASYPRDERC